MASFVFGAVIGGVFAALGIVYLVGSGLICIKPVAKPEDAADCCEDEMTDDDGALSCGADYCLGEDCEDYGTCWEAEDEETDSRG